MTAERKIFISAAIYGILGLVAGFFGRTYTHSMGMEDSNHLSVLHTHILTLGFFFFLVALTLEKLYTLSSQKKLFSAFLGILTWSCDDRCIYVCYRYHSGKWQRRK